ncbi:MAG: serine/threonine-protein kinase [Acidobacteriota bacterium]
MIEEDADSLLRAVAAAPPVRRPSRQITAVVIEPGGAGALERVRQCAATSGIDVNERADGKLLAVVASEQANAAAACALAVRAASPDARIAIVTALDGPGGFDALVATAAAMWSLDAPAGAIAIDDATADLLDARFEVGTGATRRVLLGERAKPTSPVTTPNREARIASALKDEYRLNIKRLAVIGAVVHALSFIDACVRRLASAPVWGSLFVFATARVVVLRRRPNLARWALYTFFVDAVGGIASQYRIFIVTPSTYRPEIAAFTLAMMAAVIVVVHFAAPPRLIVGIATVLAGVSSAFFAAAGQWQQLGPCTILMGAMAALGIYGQSRTKALLRRTLAEADARASDMEAANAELRRQVAERSRDLSQALARLAGAPQAARLAPGELFEDRYRIVRRIGAGGMGEVYEVERATDRRRLALKIMTGTVHREALARFAREAQIAAALDAPNLVAALDVGVTSSGGLFLVMELVTGASLATSRDRYGDARWAVPILAQVARALHAMHGRGIVHRDLKPSNILVDGDTVKVADFGIAGLIGDDPLARTIAASELVVSPELTRTGAILGTPRYMAPELARGAGAAGAAADMFSFGVVAYELLAAKLPHASPPLVEKLAGRAAAWTRLSHARPELPSELCALVDRCLSESPEDRPAAELAASTLTAIA